MNWLVPPTGTFDRRGQYDPNEPLLVHRADELACNAMAQLLLVVR